MAIRGRRPKAAGEAVNRNKSVHGWTEVENVPFEAGWPLPETRASGAPWPARTRKKWESWRSMPHCVLWGAAEWHFALDTLEIAAVFHETHLPSLAAELRYREKVLGTTLEALQGLRIRYVDVAPKLAVVVDTDDYRDV